MNNYLLIGIGVIVFLYLFLRLIPLGAWVHAHLNGLQISFLSVVFIRWRGIPVMLIINSMIRLKEANMDVPLRELEILYLEGADIGEYVEKKLAKNK